MVKIFVQSKMSASRQESILLPCPYRKEGLCAHLGTQGPRVQDLAGVGTRQLNSSELVLLALNHMYSDSVKSNLRLD